MGRPKGSTNRSSASVRSASSTKTPAQQQSQQGQQQNKLSFSNRITKPSPASSAATAGNKKASSLAQQKALKLEEEISSSAEVSFVEEPEVEKEKSVAEKDEEEDVEEVVKEEQEEEVREEKLALRQQVPNIAAVGGTRDAVEEKAQKISEAQIKKYWKGVDGERMAPRVHQADLSLHERVLRHFDMSSHFGPSIGIARTKRWKRAQRLGLNPPIEVLAVLVKDDPAMDKQSIQRAHVDELVNARFGLTLGEQERGAGGRKVS